MLGDPNVMPSTMRCEHESKKEILSEWDHVCTYVVQRLWDPGGPSYASRSSFPINLENLGQLESYIDYIHPLDLSSQPFLVILVTILAPYIDLGKIDHMGSSGYTPRLEQ